MKRIIGFNRIGIVVIALYAINGLLPIFWIAVTSLKPIGEIAVNPYGLPNSPSLDNYELILGWTYAHVGVSVPAPPLLPSLVLTTAVSFSCVLVSLVLGLMTAYGLSRYKIGGSVLPFWFLSTMFVPPIIFAFPLYLLYQRLGWLNSVFGLVMANVIFDLPFAVWIFYSYFAETPEDIEEAALVDGASSWTMFWRIVLPIMKPPAAAVCALIFIFTWNEYLFSTILMTTSKSLTVMLSSYVTGQLLFYGPIAAGIVLCALPPILVLIFFQRYLVRGLSFGAIKA
jgi:multiple sugar transport system permease protein